MKKSFQIFKRDLGRLFRNRAAVLILVGISVLPSLYAWFNIAANMDPYGNTKGIQVAIANEDKGADSEQMSLDAGQNIVDNLKKNDQLGWKFVDAKEAKKGVRSGKYYAAIVIPENFSTDMMSLFSENISKPSITYYSNAKENAIAPKVTDKGASAIQRQVNEVFIETISDTVIASFKAVTNVADQNGVESIAGNLANNLDQIGSDLNVASATLSSFAGMTTSAQQLLDTTGTFLQRN